MFSGRKYQVGLGKETTRGTAVAPSYWIPKNDVSVEEKRQYVDDDASVGVVVDSIGAEIGKAWAEGEISGNVLDRSFGLFLLGALGSVSSAVKGGETIVYEHTYSLSNANNHQSLTVEIKNDVEQKKFALGVLSSLKILAEAGKIVDFVAGFKAKKGVTASNTPSYLTTEKLFVGKHAILKTATDLSGLGAASPINVRSVEISINKNVEDHDAIGDDEPVDFANKFVSVEGNIEAMFENASDFKALFEAGTRKALRLQITNSDVTIGTGSNPELKLDLASVSFQDWSRKSGNNDLVTQTIKFKGHYSLADAKMIQIVLTNLVASY